MKRNESLKHSNTMDESQKYYIEQKTPDMKEYILCDFLTTTATQY